MWLSAPLVLALVCSVVGVTSSGGPFGARAVVVSGCAEAAALAATGDLRSARRLAIQLIGPGSGLEARRTCSEQWRAAIDPELGSSTFVGKLRQSQPVQPDLASAPSTTVDRPEPRCWWNQKDPGSIDSISTPSWSKCCAEVDPEDAGPADPALCFGKGTNGSAGSGAREWCCGFGPGTDSYAAIPALLEPFISVRLPGPGSSGRRLLRLQQGGFLRPFDLATVLWPAGFLLAQHVASVCGGRDRWRGRTVLELGAGIGLPSLAAAECGALVTATDLEDRALALIEANALDNGLVVTSRRFDWSSDRMLRDLVAVRKTRFLMVMHGGKKEGGSCDQAVQAPPLPSPINPLGPRCSF